MQRKKYSQEYKDQVIKEVLETENATTVARRYGLNPAMVSRWVRETKQKVQVLSNAPINNPEDILEAKKMVTENEQLKKLLGEKELENQILRDLLKKRTHLL